MRWFRQAADKGDAMAMDNISELYARGLGISKDCQTSRQWIEKAAAATPGAEATLFSQEHVLKKHEEILQHLRSGFDGQCQW